MCLLIFVESQVSDVSLTWQFANLLSKVWSGAYSVIHPKEFKNILGAYHPQFQDYRQVLREQSVIIINNQMQIDNLKCFFENEIPKALS